jgi:hypothetical protein
MVQAAADEAWRKARRGIDTGFGMAVGWVRERLMISGSKSGRVEKARSCDLRQPRWTLEAYKVGIHDLMASIQYTIGLGAMETFCSLLSSVFHDCKRRSRFFKVARGSALECAAIHDILLTFEAIDSEAIRYRRKLSSTSRSTSTSGRRSTSRSTSRSRSRRRKRTRRKHRTECAPCNVPFFP